MDNARERQTADDTTGPPVPGRPDGPADTEETVDRLEEEVFGRAENPDPSTRTAEDAPDAEPPD
ncbi:hypothetical protein [Pseudonocardia dioxanivorans]|jgi:hypothetical protein|uniref:hypothetical protein n=1 Tax=Pseudonocardia dioxanivorans TaxID=240495 RepID=UPI001047E63D|nr:hypothetical protein [Pseudonocardia dioxanivorans]